jgi:hypothetical protein
MDLPPEISNRTGRPSNIVTFYLFDNTWQRVDGALRSDVKRVPVEAAQTNVVCAGIASTARSRRQLTLDVLPWPMAPSEAIPVTRPRRGHGNGRIVRTVISVWPS